jgi:hypothetical protein
VHTVGNVHSEQFGGQSKQEPLVKNRPISQVKQGKLVDYKQVKQFEDVKQHSLSESNE